MSILEPQQQQEFEKRTTRVAHFLELQFSGGTSRLTTFNQNLPAGGYSWSGLGQILNLGQLSEGEGPSARPITVAITASKAEWLALAVGPVTEYRGRPAKLYIAPLDTGYNVVGDLKLAWSGIMDAVTIGINGNDGGVEIRCETAAYALKRRPALRMNASQHKQDYPTETGFDYLVDLLANPKVWLSKKFQKV